MGDLSTPLIRLHDLAQALDAGGSLEACLAQLAEAAAKLLNAERCSIMLLDEAETRSTKLRVYAAFGPLPEPALRQRTGPGEGIAGHVLATGKPLLVEDLASSAFVHAARRLGEGGRSLLSAPIVVNRAIIGVVNVSEPKSQRPFNLDDLHLLDVVALFIGKSVRVAQLESVLNSRFAQMALAREAEAAIGSAIAQVSHDPNQLARIVAKSFFREMTRAGFSARQIIHAASEIIALLNASITKHSKRLARK